MSPQRDGTTILLAALMAAVGVASVLWKAGFGAACRQAYGARVTTMYSPPAGSSIQRFVVWHPGQ